MATVCCESGDLFLAVEDIRCYVTDRLGQAEIWIPRLSPFVVLRPGRVDGCGESIWLTVLSCHGVVAVATREVRFYANHLGSSLHQQSP